MRKINKEELNKIHGGIVLPVEADSQDDTNNKLYAVNGIATQNPKGIYIINGKKFSDK